MSEEQAIQFLQQGIAAAKAKQNEQARQLLQNAIRLNPANETAWLWLSSVAKDNKERVFCLRQLLQINPNNEMALKGLKAMGIAGDEPTRTAEVQSGVPRPQPEKVLAAQQALESIIERVTQQPDPFENIEWVHKRRNRAGERTATMFNIGIRLAPLVIILCLLGTGYLVANHFRDELTGVVFAPTWTPSYTPTVTPTPTPGFTPTPSPTPRVPYTATPEIDPDLPQGDLFVESTVTPVYPSINSRPLREALVAMDRGEYAEVLPTLVRERELTSSLFDSSPYYYEAIALIETGDTDRAERTLEEGITRLEELREIDRQQQEPLLHAGLAAVFEANGDLEASNEQANMALEGDPRLPQPYIILARNALETDDYEEAASIISQGLDVNKADANLWILRGELNLRRRQPAEAQQDARVALYIDPTAEDAYLLQASADSALGDYGLAVLHLQDYLFIYPGSIEGWTLLGDARVNEGNGDLAIAAYSRAVNTSTTLSAQVPALVARAALYTQRNQFDLAIQDYDRILRLDRDDVAARESRAIAAYRAGHFGESIEDIDTLLEETPTRNDLRLLKARALVDGANPRNEDAYTDALRDALNILAGSFPTLLEDDLQAAAYEYRARILFTQSQYRDALNDIERALARQESGSRHYWRGRILEEQSNLDDAIQEYEWVRLWGNVYDFPFLPDTLSRLEAIEGDLS